MGEAPLGQADRGGLIGANWPAVRKVGAQEPEFKAAPTKRAVMSTMGMTRS
jgi:hypothetical protein